MKILQVALGKQEDIRDALKTLGEVVYWDWSGHHATFNNDIIKLNEEHKFDLIWLQLQHPGIISPQTANLLSQNAKVFNWSGDVRYPLPQWFLDIAPHCTTLFTNMNDVETMRSFGHKSEYLQIGFPTEIFKPNGPKEHFADIVFMGNNVGGFPLSSFRHQMVHALQQRYGNKFKVFGNGWGVGTWAINDQHKEAEVYRGCKVAINCSHFNYKRYSSDRLFRLMGAGAHCLSHHYYEIEKEFEIGAHLETWKTIDELISKIDMQLNMPNPTNIIAKQGCDHVHTNHTWKNRIQELKKLL